MKLKVITPDETLFEEEINSLNIAEKFGSFSILKDHAPLIAIVKDFVSTIQTGAGALTYVAASSGTLKVVDNEVSLIIDYGVVASSKEEAKKNLTALRKEMAGSSEDLGDDTIANLEIELVKRMQELGR